MRKNTDENYDKRSPKPLYARFSTGGMADTKFLN